MADIYTSAADVIPIQPTTRFFDPGESLGIMQRYGASAVNRAFAEDALKSANEIDKASYFDPIDRRNDLEKHGWLRVVKGRDDEDYDRRKEAESTFAEWSKSVFEINLDAEDADKRLAELAADPAIRDYEPARGILNNRFGELETRRRERVQRLDKENSIEWRLAEAGIDPKEIYSEDGRLDTNKALEAFRRLGEAEAGAKARKEQLDDLKKPLDEEAHLLDQPQEANIKLREERLKGLEAAASRQEVKIPDSVAAAKLLDEGISKAAFVAAVLDFNKTIQPPKGLSKDQEWLYILKAREQQNPALKQLSQAAVEVWRAHYAIQHTSPGEKTPAGKKAPGHRVGSTPGEYDPISDSLPPATR